ncbi:unnamed protein product [Meganyctiphanes norvegica]|uniref:SET domain-containing protein n=1 Tax=Meganyctiphanes norvegica TaxID=48144 RepID=A0AAV2RZ68_MEGNR
MTNDSITNGNGDTKQIYGKQETNNVHVFQKYMLTLLDYNPQWLGSQSPDWCKDMKVSNSLHVDKALEWAGQNKKDSNSISDSLLDEAPVCIAVNDMFGRHLVANRNIKAGEIIIAEPPLILSLRMRSPPYCSTCHSRVDGKFACSDCGYFFCGTNCLDESHREECQILQKLGLGGPSEEDKFLQNKAMQDRLEKMPEEQRAEAQEILNTAQNIAWTKRTIEVLKSYNIINTVRTLITMGHSKQQRDLIMALSVHVDQDNFRYRANQKGIVNVIINKLQASTDPDLIHHIAGVWDTNAFEVPLSKGSVNGIYPFVSLLTHNCRSNCQQWFTGPKGVLILRSIEDIKEGSMVTTCYTDPQWGTRLRQDHLKISKQFICSCERCNDPTENGTFTGSVLCQKCLGPMISTEPLNSAATWRCGNDCGHTLTAMEVCKLSKSTYYRCKKCGSEMETKNPLRFQDQWHCKGGCGHTLSYAKLMNESGRISAKLRGLESSMITETASVTEDLKSRLHSHHFVLTQLYWSRVKSYTSVNLTELSDEELERLTDVSTLLLSVIQKLEAPLSRLRVRIGREYVRSRCEQLRRLQEKGNNIEKYLKDLGELVQECSVVLCWDNGWMPPVNVHIDAYENLKLPHSIIKLQLDEDILTGEQL